MNNYNYENLLSFIDNTKKYLKQNLNKQIEDYIEINARLDLLTYLIINLENK